jgi:hypothetical protein
MKKTTMLTALFTVICCGAAAEAQVYVQPANYYTQPANYGTYNGNYTVSQPLYSAPAAYSQPAYTPVSNYTPVATYYAGSACGQPVQCSYNPCCNQCACNPCATYATTYAPASPCVPQAAYAPVTYAPAPACGPQIRRGLLGQPVVYVPGQPLRNALRFLAP